MRKPLTVLGMAPSNVPRLFDGALRERLHATAEIDFGTVLTGFESANDAEVLFTCWGAPTLDQAALAKLPNLKAVVHSAGSVKGFVTDAVWRRGIVVSSAVAANAVPVAEYTISMILLAGKDTFRIASEFASGASRNSWYAGVPNLGNYRRTIGIVGASRVGRKVMELLRPYDVDVLLADPTIDEATAADFSVRKAELDDLVSASDVVSIHAPDVPETYHLFDARQLALMKDGATLVNTARGRLVDTGALTAEAAAGRISAVLDVTDPEPLPAGHPLYSMPNVVVTPHIAGSQGNEVRRMGELAVSELERYSRGEQFLHPVLESQLAILA